MKELPFKIKGMYYRIKPKNYYNPSKINRIWNIITDRPVLNGDVYDIIYFGELEIQSSNEKKYYVGIDFNLLHHDFRKLAQGYISNVKCDIWENENYCYDFRFDKNKVYFKNEIWKCSGEINGSHLQLSAKNKATGKSVFDVFNYYSIY